MKSKKENCGFDVFAGEQQLRRSGFVHCNIKRPSDQGGLHSDNILLTAAGLRLIDVGISAIREQMEERFFPAIQSLNSAGRYFSKNIS